MSAAETEINTSNFIKISILDAGYTSSIHLVKKLGGLDDGRQYVMKEHICSNDMEPEKTILNILKDSAFVSKMHYHFVEEGRGYIILDYYGGGSLEKLMAPGINLSEESVKYLLGEIILGIENFHSLGVIHRDIKPKNICLDNEGHAVIIDFGLAKILTQEENKAYSFCGTAGFMAPEVEEKSPSGYDQSADFWSLGVTAYLLVNKRFTPQSYIQSKLSSEFKDFVSRLLLRSPDERLGGGGGGTEALKRHPFFKEMNWSELAKKSIKSPFL